MRVTDRKLRLTASWRVTNRIKTHIKHELKSKSTVSGQNWLQTLVYPYFLLNQIILLSENFLDNRKCVAMEAAIPTVVDTTMATTMDIMAIMARRAALAGDDSDDDEEDEWSD